MASGRTPPVVTGISPRQGIPGTQITIRGENLGNDRNDIISLVICGTDCLVTTKWKSSSKIVARIGQAKRGIGDIVIVTRSGGRGVSNVQFRVFIEDIGMTQESAVWVDESRSVPGRNVIMNVAEVTEVDNVLGLKLDTQRKLDHATLSNMFPEKSGNLRMESFKPAWYLLENHKNAPLSDLRLGFKNLNTAITKEEETSKNIHKANLHSLINCVNALDALHSKMDEQINRGAKKWPMTSVCLQKIEESMITADKLFCEVLNRKDSADATRNALSVLTRFRFIFFLAESIDENIHKGEYSTILQDYTRAKSLFKDSEFGLFEEVMVVLDQKIELLKETIKQKLMEVPTSFEKQSKLIKYLKILDNDSDPAWDCITAYHCWLENVFWELQNKYYTLAIEEEKHQQNEGINPDLSDGHHPRDAFVTELLLLLTEKLQSFLKISQSYSNTNDERFYQKRSDIDQMLKNTINVSSWLLLNALVPTSLPDIVSKQYKDQFVSWPSISPQAQTNYLFASLKALRHCIKSLFELHFTRDNVQPLIELCMTIRFKCLGLVIESGRKAITFLGTRENWKMDRASNQSKTSLPDLYETEIKELIPNIKQILSFGNFIGEVDLFSQERIQETIIGLFVVLLGSFRDCCDELLQLKSLLKRRPNRLDVSGDNASLNSSINENDARSKAPHEVQSRKLLITICNLEHVINHSLSSTCARLGENGVKSVKEILNETKNKFYLYRKLLVKHYIGVKTATILSVLESADYFKLPEEEDVSDFVKELIMCVVLIQAELYLLFPQLTKQVLLTATNTALEGILQLIPKVDLSVSENATQIIIDLAALEEAFQFYLPPQTRTSLNSIRARLMGKLDKESFQASIRCFRKSLQMAIESLRVVDEEKEEKEEDEHRQSSNFEIVEENEDYDDI